MNGEAGKGDTPRPVNQKKYRDNYVRIFGIKCPVCGGTGKRHGPLFRKCETCDGVGHVEQYRK